MIAFCGLDCTKCDAYIATQTYLEDPATGSGNSAFANYILSQKLWDGQPIAIEQGGNNRIFNAVKLKYQNDKVLFGGKSTKKIEGVYLV